MQKSKGYAESPEFLPALGGAIEVCHYNTVDRCQRGRLFEEKDHAGY